ncbi:uncharacterized protein LOC127751419 [Frankliniella occidentalis]|uniref:Uncharacterized protein LOC127751419 n=1 Tax=Frankliniella occidentalis TaxID=133901 RepID=A0A9C6X889_FRAOC|nr:uncharacterized protein LOC127751419 [Frankliniella occidentalis]
MRKRSKSAYLAALEKLKTLVPRFKPEKIMTDYEGAEQNALAEAFPNAEVHGCLFHYSKAIGTNARKLGMYKVMKKSPHVRSLVRWLSCLLLLPMDYIRKGFRIITRRAIKKRVSHHLVGLQGYWMRTWHPKLHLLSVSGCADRTSNASESDNRALQDSVPVKRPNVWDFIDGVIEMEDSTYLTIKVLDRPGNVTRSRPLSAVSNDRTIKALTEELQGGFISVRRFLKVASYTTLKSLNRGLNGKKRRRNI